MRCGPNSEVFRGARLSWLAAGLLLAAVGCSDDDAGDKKSDHTARATDAGGGADASEPEPEDELRELIATSIAAYDRQIETSCPCFVEHGGYKSVDECVMWQKSADHWVSCGTEAVRSRDSQELRDGIRCVKERADQNSECDSANV